MYNKLHVHALLSSCRGPYNGVAVMDMIRVLFWLLAVVIQLGFSLLAKYNEKRNCGGK